VGERGTVLPSQIDIKKRKVINAVLVSNDLKMVIIKIL
jgi:hypothetical protein